MQTGNAVCIGIATYRALSILTVALLVVVVVLATAGKSIEAAIGLAFMLAIVLSQALLLRCHHCGARPGLWILAIWTLLLDYELYVADTLLLRQCPRCKKPLSQTEAPSA